MSPAARHEHLFLPSPLSNKANLGERGRTSISIDAISCLDDAELALLGVPWETYREVASEIGLDIIRFVWILFMSIQQQHRGLHLTKH
jgi:hypothetical protein